MKYWKIENFGMLLASMFKETSYAIINNYSEVKLYVAKCTDQLDLIGEATESPSGNI